MGKKNANVAQELNAPVQEAPKAPEATQIPATSTEKKPASAAEMFQNSLTAAALIATVKDGHEIRHKANEAELVELAEKTEPVFRAIGEHKESAQKNSAELYAMWSPLFPIRVGVTGKANISEFGEKIYQTMPDAAKTPATGKAGFLSCQSAAKERNHVAIGIVSMCRWVTENKKTLLAHLGVIGADDNTKKLQGIKTALEKVEPFVKELGIKVQRIGEDGEVESAVMGLEELLAAVYKEHIAAKLAAFESAMAGYKIARKAELAAEDKGEEPAEGAAE